MIKPSHRWWFPFILFFLIAGVGATAGLLYQAWDTKTSTSQTLQGWQIIRPPHEISTLAVDGETIWAGGRDGVWRLEISGTAVPTALDCGFPLYYVRALLVETPGSLWIGHGAGLTYFDGGTCRTYTTRDGLPSDRIFSLLLDREARLWIGSENGAAMQDGDTWQIFDTDAGLLVNSVNVILQDQQGGMWFGSNIAPKGGLSICLQNDCQHFTTENGLPHNNITSLLEDEQGDVWVGTGFSNYGGAARFTWSEDRWQMVEILSNKEGLAGEKVRSIFQDSSGAFWFGSEFDGLARWDGTYWRVFNEEDGLCNLEPKAIQQDGYGNLWIGTRDGITRISAEGLEILSNNP